MSDTGPSASTKIPLSERLKALVVEYGSLALWVYFAIFALVLFGFAAAISMGVHVASRAMTVGTWGAAYVATKITQPLRIAATLVLTPVVMKVLRLKKRPRPQETAKPES
jgi:hypothetical protein